MVRPGQLEMELGAAAHDKRVKKEKIPHVLPSLDPRLESFQIHTAP